MVVLLLGMTQAVAQEYEYIPFVREGVQWVCNTGHYPIFQDTRKAYFTLELKGDVEINGNVYKAMHKYSGDAIDSEHDTVLVYLREEDKVVYGIVPDGKTNPNYPIGMDTDTEMMRRLSAGEEFVLYDFNNPVQFIQGWITNPYMVQPVIADVTDVAGQTARRYISYYNSHNFGDFCIIEGIGYDGFLHWYPLGYGQNISMGLSHVIENGEVIYRSEQYRLKREDELLPLVREGVQWVNEKVIINKGDTTRSYYNYEFRGENFRNYPICYSYTGDVLDTEQATISAILITHYDYQDFRIRTYKNDPFIQTREEGRNLMSYSYIYEDNGLPFFCFAETDADIGWYHPVNFYIRNQNEQFLNRQNFVEVDPVEIEGIECRRYAYTGEDGKVQAYYVEGIGFDSRDMGDLLTPFTRKPDPDADYQEYCGLSHVIKDGKIIYKGLRYRGDAEVGLRGDVNGDGCVDIKDVTDLIDMLLHAGDRYTASYDVDNNGTVSVSDVTVLIDLLLTQGQ